MKLILLMTLLALNFSSAFAQYSCNDISDLEQQLRSLKRSCDSSTRPHAPQSDLICRSSIGASANVEGAIEQCNNHFQYAPDHRRNCELSIECSGRMANICKSNIGAAPNAQGAILQCNNHFQYAPDHRRNCELSIECSGRMANICKSNIGAAPNAQAAIEQCNDHFQYAPDHRRNCERSIKCK